MAHLDQDLRALKSKLQGELTTLEQQHQQLLKRISKLHQQIEAIDLLLPEGQERLHLPSAKKSSLPPGEEFFTPAHIYWPAILESLVEFGDSARGEQVIDKVGQKLDSTLTAADREMLPSGVDLRWRNRAAWQRYNMVRQGLLKSGSPRGIWEITDQGKRWLEEIKKR